MTEAEWWAATQPDKFIDSLFYDRTACTRKFRLFWVACCRELTPLIPDYRELVEFLELIEQNADQSPTDSARGGELRSAAYDRLCRCEGPYTPSSTIWNAYLAIVLSGDDYADGRWLNIPLRNRTWEHGVSHRDPGPTPRDVTKYCILATFGSARPHQIRILHDIFGPLPFRDVAIAAEWFTSDVIALARGIYDEKAFDRMPILADALQDAGCDNDEILGHCRDEKCEHVRGCWVVDLLHGKPWREGA